MSGRTYSSIQDAIRVSDEWTAFPNGGCACSFGVCTRLDKEGGCRDFYEPCEPRLEEAGLPWFYFVTLACLHPTFHARFKRESKAHWGSEA